MTRRFFILLWALLVATAPSVGAQVTQQPRTGAAASQGATAGLVTQLRQRISASGLAAEQIRTRLTASGYREDFLNNLLPGSSGPAEVSEETLEALEKIGITGRDDRAPLRMLLQPDSTQRSAGARQTAVQDDSARGPGADTLAYRLFGLETFRQANAGPVPSLEGPVDANYRLGPGDRLLLVLTGSVEISHALEVNREGFVVIPQVGQIGVANLTLAQLEDLLYTRLSRSYSGIRRGADAPTKFFVSVTGLRSIQVFVTGDVQRPGSYRSSSAATAMTILYEAGGPTDRGTFRSVLVRRAGVVAATVDLYDYLLRGDNASDIRLENGDIVFVGTHGPRVRVAGEVVRPATFELKESETLRDVVQFAGGLRPTASATRVRISRILGATERREGGSDRTVLDVSMDGAALPALPLVGGDEVTLFPVANRVRNSVTVLGHVWNPGVQGLRPGQRLSEALRVAGGPKPDVYLGQVSISRLRSDSTRVSLRAMLRDTTGAVVEDIELQQDDQITVFSLSEFRPERYVAIGGSVRRPGQYRWRLGMTLRDLVLESGGLTEGAYLREAEVARADDPSGNREIVRTIRVPLDSSFLPTAAEVSGAAATPMPAGAAGVVLLPYDNVLIMQQPDWSLPRSVVLSGEVKFPGRYTLTSKDDRISDVVRRAGGLTEDAAADGAYFARAVNLTSFEGGSSGGSRARVGLNLERALREPRSSDNVLLLNEDSLHVPLRLGTIEIRGAVNLPTTVSARSGRNLSFYVRAAGGPSMTGDADRAYVIQPNGQIQSRRRILYVLPLDPTPRPGATVVVPVRAADNRLAERLSVISLIAQTVTSLVTVYALFR